MTNRLVKMINLTSTHVVESNLINRTSGSGIENNPKFLCQLIELTFEQFKCMAHLYRHFIEYSMAKLIASSMVMRYQWSQVWTSIQNVIMQLLEEYLDIRGFNQVQSSADLMDKMDINAFFVRKRLINLGFGGDSAATAANTAVNAAEPNADVDEKNNRRLFTFKGSSHAMSITNYIREQNNENLFGSDSTTAGNSSTGEDSSSAAAASEHRTFKILVCQPDHRNITSIFATMEHIVKDIADELRTRDMTQTVAAAAAIANQDMILERFLQDFILNTFIHNAVDSITLNARIQSTVDGMSILVH